MKKIILITLFSLIFINCGTRKKQIQTEKEVFKTETSGTQEISGETISEISGESSHKLNSDFLNFQIEPTSDIAKFSFFYNGKKIEGETTGKLNFTNEKKQVENKVNWTNKVHTTYKSLTTYKTKTFYKTLIKQKESESKRSEFAWYLLAWGFGVLTAFGCIIYFYPQKF